MENNITERHSEIKKASDQAKTLGIKDRSQIAEAIIDAKGAQKKGILDISEEDATKISSVAQNDIRNEPQDVQERAINKYFEFGQGNKNVTILVDAIHAVIPNQEEIIFLYKQVSNGDNNSLEKRKEIEKEIKKQFVDESTGIIAKTVAENVNASYLIANRSKAFSEANRYWWKREEKSLKSANDESIAPYEYSRRVKAAMFWAIDKVLHGQGNLDSEKKLTKPFYRIAVHGMDNNPDFDFAIAGSRDIASEESIQLFNKLLVSEIYNSDLRVNGLNPSVVIAKKEDQKTKKYSGAASLNHYRKDVSEENFQHPSFGENFQNIQLEISARLRKDDNNREKVISILTNVLKRLNREGANLQQI